MIRYRIRLFLYRLRHPMFFLPKEFQKQDWRKVKLPKHDNHLTLRWYHWSKRPRLAFCYWEQQMCEQRTQAVRFGKL